MSSVGLGSGSQPGAILLPRDIWKWLETVFVVTADDGEPQVSGGWRLGMLKNSARCTGQPWTARVICSKCQ